MTRYIQCLIAILMLILTGCMGDEGGEYVAKDAAASERENKELNQESIAKFTMDAEVRKAMEDMTIDDMIAQMMYVGLNGTSLSQKGKEMIASQHVGGIILLGRNVTGHKQLDAYVSSIKQANHGYDVPLFVGVDEEGGRVSRIPSALRNIPSSKQIGDQNNPDLSYQVGELLAKKVEQYGFNMDFAPVLDINNNPNNPVIGDRSFGAEPSKVSELGIATMKGIASEGVVPVVKHFPGHGDTSVDSHINLPKINKTLNELDDFELVPFKNAVDEGADMVMVAHILFPELDQTYPATLSKSVITGVLREKLQFDGVVITDDMTMGAISNEYGMEQAAVLSIKAGSDMVMIANPQGDQYESVQQTIKQTVEKGEISKESIEKSVRRILALKQKYNLDEKSDSSPSQEELNNQIEDVIGKVK
ncbi:beta-N-acetylhexosaminidase [Pontibacillus yanchengensis]|uniref:Beta-N-acetylhexosaminidase n=1 Tax=Pontibacillus yanchengensis TaxID=462910 RepID=A0A6I4ZWX8_9BACI|nr:beta-N-acetylhexosaminidase [Pontibacillus yanchengensis]MYL34608.1 beta-N-acetylhexosaminidase [Pontibacillus yanchengensis]